MPRNVRETKPARADGADEGTGEIKRLAMLPWETHRIDADPGAKTSFPPRRVTVFLRSVRTLSNSSSSDDAPQRNVRLERLSPDISSASKTPASPEIAPDRAAASAVAGGLTCRFAKPNEIFPALSIILATRGRPASDAQVRQFASSIEQRDLPLDALWVAEQGGQMRWAIFPVLSPGRTMLLFMPPLVTPTNRAAAVLLTDAVCDHHKQAGVHLAQGLLDPSHIGLADFLSQNRFVRMAELLYMQMNVHRASAPPKPPAGFAIAHYSDANRPLFEQAILRSYEQSLDCPGLAGLRDIEDIITGHMASGDFDPALWFVATENGDAKAVLLLSRLQHSDAVELVYLGIAPEARRRGLGNYFIQLALATIVKINYRRLTLAVDSLNTPALRLYYTHGLAHAGSRLAYMRNLRGKKEED